jgi:hypothetical protein
MDTDSVKLKIIFEKVAKREKTGGELNVFLLFDASGSISDSDFFKALNTGVMLRDAFDSRVKMGALQFSSHVHTIVPLTDNVEHFKSVLQGTEVHQTHNHLYMTSRRFICEFTFSFVICLYRNSETQWYRKHFGCAPQCHEYAWEHKWRALCIPFHRWEAEFSATHML